MSRSPPWTKDEIALCSLAYRRGGWPVASVVLNVCGYPRRSPAAVHAQMQKRGVLIEVSRDPLD